MIGFLGAALIIVILIVCILGFVIFGFLSVLAGKGHPGALMLVGVVVFSGLLFLTLAEVLT